MFSKLLIEVSLELFTSLILSYASISKPEDCNEPIVTK